MKTETQIKKIAARANQQGAAFIVSNSKYGSFYLYEVLSDNSLYWRHTFKEFQEACKWVAGQNQKVIFVPYIS